MAIVKRLDKGSALTYAELDGNFDHLTAADAVIQADVNAHEARTDNPHTVTATQVGLGSVDNTADADKPISTATQTALDAITDTTDAFYLSTNYADLATWLTAYNTTGANSTGNNGEVLAFSQKLFINNGYTGGLTNTAAQHKTQAVLVTTETADTTPLDAAESRIGVSVTAYAKGAHHSSGIRTNLLNSSTDGNGCTAIYTRAVSDTDANWSAATHAETRHGGGTTIGLNSENACYSATGTMYGVVVNHSTYGAETTHPITDAAKNDCDAQYGVTLIGQVDVGASDTYGWKYGIWIKDGAIKSTGKAIYVQSPATHGIHFSSAAVNSTADILLEGDSSYGLNCNGDYTNAAIKIGTDEYMAWNGTGNVKTRYLTADAAFVWEVSGTTRVEINTDATPNLKFNGTQVIRERFTGWEAATGTATRTTFATTTVTTEQLAQRLKALIDDLTAHGLIGE